MTDDNREQLLLTCLYLTYTVQNYSHLPHYDCNIYTDHNIFYILLLFFIINLRNK